jgi:hypothetical protein
MREFRRNISIFMKERGGLTLKNIFLFIDKDDDNVINEIEFAQANKELTFTLHIANP